MPTKLSGNEYLQRWPSYFTYSVMQSDGNSFYGDVVSDNFDNIYRDKDKILDQIYDIKYVCIIIMMILILNDIIRKCILRLQKH